MRDGRHGRYLVSRAVANALQHGAGHPNGAPPRLAEVAALEALRARRDYDSVELVREGGGGGDGCARRDVLVEGRESVDAAVALAIRRELQHVRLHRELTEHVVQLRRHAVNHHHAADLGLEYDVLDEGVHVSETAPYHLGIHERSSLAVGQDLF